MFENVHSLVGIIELTTSPHGSMSEVDDSSLERLLASFAEHDSLADELALPASPQRAAGWRCVVADSVYDRRTSITADLGALVSDLEREYGQVSSALRD
jgi:hypothetical protein